jgi:uncharacterized membrane protein HdeD (DUF308 family)
MSEVLTQHWWIWALRGILAVLFGLAIIAWPAAGLVVLVALFGAFALVSGLFVLGGAIRLNRWNPLGWAMLLEGLLGVAVGLATFFWPGLTALTLLFIIAFWAILTGILELVGAFRFHTELGAGHAWLAGIAGVLSVAFGLILVARPGAGALAVIWLIGFYAILFGILMLGFAFRLRSFQGHAGLRGHGGLARPA